MLTLIGFKNANKKENKNKLITLVTRHLAFHNFDYQRIMRVMSG